MNDTEILDWLEKNVCNISDWMFRFSRRGETMRDTVRRIANEDDGWDFTNRV